MITCVIAAKNRYTSRRHTHDTAKRFRFCVSVFVLSPAILVSRSVCGVPAREDKSREDVCGEEMSLI